MGYAQPPGFLVDIADGILSFVSMARLPQNLNIQDAVNLPQYVHVEISQSTGRIPVLIDNFF